MNIPKKVTVSNNVPFEHCQLLTPITPSCDIRTFFNAHPEKEDCYRDAKKKLKKFFFWVSCLPFGIILISLIEVLFHVILSKEWIVRLRFDPLKQEELWRFVTYMLVHDSWKHLSLNIIFQILYAVNLQVENWKIVLIYIASGIGAALGAASVKTDLLIGASGGVYALLTSYISLFVLNSELKYGAARLLGVFVIIIGDGIYNAYHFLENESPTISWGAHLFGALVGLLLGLSLYTSNRIDKDNKYHSLRVIAPLALLLFLIVTLIVIDVTRIKARSKGPKITNQIYRIK